MTLPPIRRLSALTLIETIVAVSIVAVLAALLLPFLSKISANARGAQVSNQMRQLSTAVFQSAGDKDGLLPGPLWDGQGFRYKGTHPECLLTHIGPYLTDVKLDSAWRVAPELMTPAQRKFYGQLGRDEAAFFKIIVTGTVIPFGYSAGSTLIQPLRIQNLDNRANLYMFREADQQASWVSQSSGYYAACPPAPLHGDHRFNTYFDGHIESVTKAQSDR